MSEHEVVQCNFAETGVCGVHGEEVERRQNSQRWQSGIAGWAILITVFVAGSYIYAREIKDDMRTQYVTSLNSVVADMKILSKQVDTLAQAQVRTDERYVSLIGAIKDMNGSITTLTYMMFEQKNDTETKKTTKK